jgi:hypothetical protein
MRKTLLAAALTLASFQAFATEVKPPPVAFKHADAPLPLLYDALKNSTIRKPIAALIAGERLPHWAKGIIKNRNYTTAAPLLVETPLPGAIVYKACRRHDCSGDQLMILVTPHKNHAYGLLKQGKGTRFVGHPHEKGQAVLKAAAQQ